jgi:hypothetical protein
MRPSGYARGSFADMQLRSPHPPRFPLRGLRDLHQPLPTPLAALAPSRVSAPGCRDVTEFTESRLSDILRMRVGEGRTALKRTMLCGLTWLAVWCATAGRTMCPWVPAEAAAV